MTTLKLFFSLYGGPLDGAAWAAHLQIPEDELEFHLSVGSAIHVGKYHYFVESFDRESGILKLVYGYSALYQ